MPWPSRDDGMAAKHYFQAVYELQQLVPGNQQGDLGLVLRFSFGLI